MSCRMYATENGPMFVCASDESAFAEPVCYICGKPATIACDYSSGSIMSMCETIMCEDHANKIDIDTHVCDKHFNEVNKKKAHKMRKELVNFGWEIPQENIGGDGI